MAYNERLAKRIRAALSNLPRVVEKKMFGGLAFMVDDKMCITAGADTIMCRIDPSIHGEVIKNKGCKTVMMRGKAYKGYVYVNAENIESSDDFNYWIALALSYNKLAKSSKRRPGKNK